MQTTTPELVSIVKSRCLPRSTTLITVKRACTRTFGEKLSAEGIGQTLREIEGDPEYDRQQEFLAVAGRVAREGRLARFVYVSQKLS